MTRGDNNVAAGKAGAVPADLRKAGVTSIYKRPEVDGERSRVAHRSGYTERKQSA